MGSSSVSASEGSGLHSILKRKLSYDSSALNREKSSNKYSLSTNSLPASCSGSLSLSPEPKPILKKKSSSEELDEGELEFPKPILKKRSQAGEHSFYNENSAFDSEGIRPILKKSPSRKMIDNGSRSRSSSTGKDGGLQHSLSSGSVISSSNRSGSGKSILKHGGILKNSWPDSFSSTSSDVENYHFSSVDETSGIYSGLMMKRLGTDSYPDEKLRPNTNAESSEMSR